MFTGKNKEDFEKWLEWQPTLESGENFNRLDFRYQQGVYLEFFDSVGMKVIPDYDINKLKWFAWFIGEKNRAKLMTHGNGKSVMYFDTRQEALKEAITKANEIYNEKI